MSNVQECIDLYLTDEQVSDAQFRAVILDARARDMISGNTTSPDEEVRADLTAHAHALVLLNRIDDVRRDQIEALRTRMESLDSFVGGLTGRVRVLRERLDNLEGK